MRFLLVAALVLTATTAIAENIQTTDGVIYKNVTIGRVEKDGINIVHSTGAAKIPFEKLPAELQTRFGFDGAKAAEQAARYRATQEEIRRQQDRARQEQEARATAEREEAQKQIALQEAQKRERAETAKATEERQRREAAAQLKEEQARAERAAIEQRATLLVGITIAVIIYFVPSMVGSKKQNSLAIFVLNLFAGWTFVGWVVALVWACTKDPHELRR